MVFHPAPLMVALPFIFAFWLLFEGINLAISSFDFKRVGFRRWWIVCCFGVLAACFGVYCLVNPNVSAETIAWIVGLGIILDGIGNWVKVAVVNKVEKRFVKLHDRLREVTDIDWEEVK